jgi:serine/threonine protein kinase
VPDTSNNAAVANGTTSRRQGRYVLRDLLGRGGMGEVFSGYVIGSHGFQKPVAIKRLLPELANDQVLVNRLISEAKLLVGMDHGNIVSVLDLARDGGDVFLVMEFVDGPSLCQLTKSLAVRTRPALSFAISTYIVQSAAAGLQFAHNRPGGAVIHADISPSNLLLTTSGEVRVADFGIARREGGGAGIVEGKWAYMAPEQLRGEPLTPRSDVFALGVVLYDLISGEHPFSGCTSGADREERDPTIVPARTVNPSVPRGLDAVCMRALAHDPNDRYPNMQALIDAIVDERFANGWREAANDLAQLIRSVGPNQAADVPRTHVTRRPVTIHTRSLISRPQRPGRRPSEPVVPYETGSDASDPLAGPSHSVAADDLTSAHTRLLEVAVPRRISGTGTHTPITGSGAHAPVTGSGVHAPITDVPAITTPPRPSTFELTKTLDALAAGVPPRASEPNIARPAPPQVAGRAPLQIESAELARLSSALLSPSDLAVVHGGAVTQVIRARQPRTTYWGAYAVVFGIAAIIGMSAAIASHTPAVEPRVAEDAGIAPPVAAEVPAPVAADVPPPVAATVPVPPSVAATVPVPPPVAYTVQQLGADAAVVQQSVADVVPPPVAASDDASSADRGVSRTHRPVKSKRAAKKALRVAPARGTAAATAILRVNQTGIDPPWAFVSVDGKRSDAPAKFQLAPGQYKVKLDNPDLHLSRTCTVTVHAEEVVTLKINLESGHCDTSQ